MSHTQLDIPATSDYAVSVNGRPVAVYAMPTRYGQTLENGKPVSVYDGAPLRRPMYFACADIGGPTEVTVEIGFLPESNIHSVTAHPLSRGIVLRREGARVTFAVDRPGTVTLMVNGDHTNGPLHLFFSPPVEAPPEGAIVLEAGYHDLGYDNPITLTDGQTLYLAPGAWVEGVVNAKNAHNIRIMGRGVLSQRRSGGADYAGGAAKLVYDYRHPVVFIPHLGKEFADALGLRNKVSRANQFVNSALVIDTARGLSHEHVLYR